MHHQTARLPVTMKGGAQAPSFTSGRGWRVNNSTSQSNRCAILMAAGSRVVKRAYSYRFYPDPEQSAQLAMTFGEARPDGRRPGRTGTCGFRELTRPKAIPRSRRRWRASPRPERTLLT